MSHADLPPLDAHRAGANQPSDALPSQRSPIRSSVSPTVAPTGGEQARDGVIPPHAQEGSRDVPAQIRRLSLPHSQRRSLPDGEGDTLRGTSTEEGGVTSQEPDESLRLPAGFGRTNPFLDAPADFLPLTSHRSQESNEASHRLPAWLLDLPADFRQLPSYLEAQALSQPVQRPLQRQYIGRNPRQSDSGPAHMAATSGMLRRTDLSIEEWRGEVLTSGTPDQQRAARDLLQEFDALPSGNAALGPFVDQLMALDANGTISTLATNAFGALVMGKYQR
jgi:hypothetical protein